MDLLVSYSWHQFGRAKNEIMRLLKRFGDEQPEVEKSQVWGVSIVHSGLDNREVIARCHQLFQEEPQAFEWAIKWVPVDWWCTTDLEAMKQVIEERIKDQIPDEQTWGMKVNKRRWQKYHTREIIEYLATGISQRVNLDNPDKLIWVDIVGKKTAISLLQAKDIFSLNLSHF